jgi:hypothetical protein
MEYSFPKDPPSVQEWSKRMREASPEQALDLRVHALESFDSDPSHWGELLVIAANILKDRGITY